MGNVQYQIKENGRNKSVYGERLNSYLAAKYIQDRGWLVDHIPSGKLASGAYFQDVETANKFADMYVLAMGKYITQTSMFITVPDELRQFKKFLNMLEEHYKGKNSPINVADIRIVIFRLLKETK